MPCLTLVTVTLATWLHCAEGMINASTYKAVQVLLGAAEDLSILTLTDMTVSEGVTHELLAINPHQKRLLLTMIGVNTAIGLFYRILLIKNVVQTGLFSRPINLLTGFLRAKNSIQSRCFFYKVVQ